MAKNSSSKTNSKKKALKKEVSSKAKVRKPKNEKNLLADKPKIAAKTLKTETKPELKSTAEPTSSSVAASKFKKINNRFVLVSLATLLSFCLLSVFLFYSLLVYGATPENIRNPEFEHLHFRMQLFIDGKYVDFSQPEFQEEYVKGTCTTDLTETPIHFHDGVDQLVHIHWKGITGGQVLKYYGLNYVGGFNDTLGYANTPDSGFWPKRIAIKDKLLNKPSAGKKAHIYVVEDYESKKLVKKSLDKFLNKSIEEFFGKTSTIQSNNSNKLTNPFAIKANAHITDTPHDHDENGQPVDDKKTETTSNSDKKALSQEELKEVNNLVGDVLIYFQNDVPTNEELGSQMEEFKDLQPSVCGG